MSNRSSPLACHHSGMRCGSGLGIGVRTLLIPMSRGRRASFRARTRTSVATAVHTLSFPSSEHGKVAQTHQGFITPGTVRILKMLPSQRGSMTFTGRGRTRVNIFYKLSVHLSCLPSVKWFRVPKSPDFNSPGGPRQEHPSLQ